MILRSVQRLVFAYWWWCAFGQSIAPASAAASVAAAAASKLPRQFAILSPSRFSHPSTDSTLTIRWVTEIPDPDWVKPAAAKLPEPALSVSDETARREGLRTASEIEREKLLRVEPTAPLLPVCDFSKGVTISFQCVSCPPPAVVIDASQIAFAPELEATTNQPFVIASGFFDFSGRGEYEWSIPAYLPSGEYTIRVSCDDPAV